jgi:hypothetical protein
MNIHGASTITIVSVAALVLLGASIADTQPSPSVTRATVCVNSNGQLRMPASSATGCGPSERLVRWVVDGDVNDVRVGTGLVASREGGLVNLALDPSVLGCESCNFGKVFAGFNDGPGQIPMGEPPVHEPQQIAELNLPEGDYAIFAKVLLANHETAVDALVRCRLSAGADSDEADVVLENTQQGGGQMWGEASREVMTLQVVHRFDTAGVVALSCADGFSLPELLGGQAFDAPAQFTHLKIIAMKASSISNVVLGGQ